MKTRTKFGIGFGAAGFLIAAMLCAFTFYGNSHRDTGVPSIAVYLLLCPFSFMSMALDNAGVVGGLVGWGIISLANAALYCAIGFGVGEKIEKRRA